MNERNLIENLCGKSNSFALTFDGSQFEFIHSSSIAKPFQAESSEQGFIFAPFNSNSIWPFLFLEAKNTFRTNDQNDLADYIEALTKVSSSDINLLPNLEIGKTEYLSLIEKVKSDLSEEFPKVVISRIHEVDKSVDALSYFFQLCKRYPQNGNYIFYSPQSGLWMGSSPEVLIDINQNRGYTCSLAGTKNTAEKWTNKEEEEQAYVTDFVRSTIQSFYKIENERNEIIELKGIKHLKTNFSFVADTFDNWRELVQKLHPTPAVGGIPQKKAQEYIEETEPHDRMYYTGYFGRIQNQQVKLFVNLRSLQVSESKFRYYLGGGITQKSKSLSEFNETENKLKSLLFNH